MLCYIQFGHCFSPRVDCLVVFQVYTVYYPAAPQMICLLLDELHFPEHG